MILASQQMVSTFLPGFQTQKTPKTLGFRGLKWWRRRELNPRPKTINPGFYMFIPNFIIDREVSFRRDTTQHILKNLTFETQEISKAVLQSRRPDLNLQEGCQEDGSRLKRLQRSYNRLRLYLYLPSLRVDKHSTCYHGRQNLRRNHYAPKL